jgi:LuxR family transcriptional regulator, maltose regulon positive regulatory protein
MGKTRKRAAGAPAGARPANLHLATHTEGTAPIAPGFELLQSKLAIPPFRTGLVRRTALVSRLQSASRARVVRITAPAGYGKTTLLGQWAASDPRPVAWVSVDKRDNDPVALLTYVAAALDRVDGVDPAVFRAAASAGDSLWSIGVPRIGAALASTTEPILLVLDDVHELHDRDCLDALESLEKNLSEGSLLVLSGRSGGDLPLARLRAEGQLYEVGPTDLTLTNEDARSLLSTAGVAVSEADAAQLNERAEGWAAGLYLAALVIQQSDVSPAEAIASFSGTDRFVVDYFRSENLSGLDRSDVEFLTRTSVLERMSGPLCDEVTGRSDSARRLQALEEANLFLVPLDHRREWYRFHHLFQDMLRSELERAEPEVISILHNRAASWHELHGSAEAAIDHAFGGKDVEGAARLVSTHALPYYRSGRVVTVERWFKWFDEPELLARYPAVSAFGAWVNALRGRPDEADRFAYALEHTTHDGPMPDGTESARPWAAMVRALLCRHGISVMRADAAEAVDGLGPMSYWRPIALVLLGTATLLEDAEVAEEIFTKAAEEALGSGAIYAGVVAHSQLALLALGRGDQKAAEVELRHAERFLQNQPTEDYLPNMIKLAASARLALERRRAATARELLLMATRLRPTLSRAIPWFAVQTKLELARTHLGLADVDGAKILLREAEDIIREQPDLGTLVQKTADLRTSLGNTVGLGSGWASTLTAAELRLLPLLTTHLSFREIADRLYVSRNTVKSQAISVYRKLDASSRSEAIERAVALGLVDAPIAEGPTSFIPKG